jgi:RND family efflux transporter MFP subunit
MPIVVIAAPQTPRRGKLIIFGFLAIAAASLTRCGGVNATATKPAPTDSKPATVSLQDRVRVRTESLTRDAIASFLETTSHVEAISEADLYPKTTGIVRKILVEEGDRVAEGQVLAILDQVEANISLKQAEIALEESKRTVEEANLAIEESQKKEFLGRTDADQAKRDYERDAKLSTSGDGSGLRILAPKVVEGSKLLWDRAENSWQIAQFLVKKSQLSLAAAETGRKKAEWAVELARVRLADTEIKSNFAGVVANRGIKLGETATPTTRVFKITDLDNLQTVFYRPQRDLKLLLNGGQEVTATSEAIPNDPKTLEPCVFAGRVERVAPVVDPQSGSFKVTASLKNRDSMLRPGILVRVRVTLGRRENAYLIPKRARVLDGERPYVFVVRDGLAVRVPIVEGFSDEHRVEVRNINSDGLRDDDQVVVVASVDLKEGLKVQLENAATETAGG